MIPLFKVYMSSSAPEAAARVLRSGYIGQGPIVEEFENSLREFFSFQEILTLNSGTSALQLALRLAGVGPGSEVISVPLTCFATNAPILASGASIRWADVDPATCNIDIPDLVSQVSDTTSAVVVVHWGGIPVDLDRLKSEVSAKLGFCPPIIEDCAHSFGATYKGKKVGSLGNFSCFSLQAIKHCTSVDGGLLFCPDEESYNRGKLLRWYGISREEKNKTDFRCEIPIEEWGYKFHMNDMCAAIGLENLKDVEFILQRHRENAEFYSKTLARVDGLDLFRAPDKSSPAYWLFTCKVDRRDDFIRAMSDRGIQTSMVHQRNDVHPCLSEARRSLPKLDSFANRVVCLPVGWWVSDENREKVVESIGYGW